MMRRSLQMIVLMLLVAVLIRHLAATKPGPKSVSEA
jgi:hypothetical protein